MESPLSPVWDISRCDPSHPDYENVRAYATQHVTDSLLHEGWEVNNVTGMHSRLTRTVNDNHWTLSILETPQFSVIPAFGLSVNAAVNVPWTIIPVTFTAETPEIVNKAAHGNTAQFTELLTRIFELRYSHTITEMGLMLRLAVQNRWFDPELLYEAAGYEELWENIIKHPECPKKLRTINEITKPFRN